jgi:murein DD-endopeptidase MepM/ murein hydrolase activator NlpD
MRAAFLAWFIIVSLSLHSQPVKKSVKDFIQIKPPAIKYVAPDSTSIFDDKDHSTEEKGKVSNYFIENSQEKKPYYFEPERLPSGADADSGYVSDDDFEVVEVDEEYNIDSNWVKITEYYSIWDSRAVNPYKMDPTELKDTVTFIMYDSASFRYWSPPLGHGVLNDDFGPRRYRWHYGVDLDLEMMEPVRAAFDGIVRICQYDKGGYGNYVLIRHYNGLETIYGHLTRQLVKVGDYVKAGEMVGLGGSTGRSTGPHLHFEVRYQGYAIDPEHFYDFHGQNKLRNRIIKVTPKQFQYLKQARLAFYHKIRPGDTMLEIAERYRVPMRRILKLNGMTSRTVLRVGRRIRIR